jgi:hypothetical protein
LNYFFTSLALKNTLYFLKESFDNVVVLSQYMSSSDYGTEHAGKSKQAVLTSSAHAA